MTFYVKVLQRASYYVNEHGYTNCPSIVMAKCGCIESWHKFDQITDIKCDIIITFKYRIM